MPWQNLSVVVTSDAAERLEALLRSSGAVSVTMADAGESPIFEPDLGKTPLWARVKISALFPVETNLSDLEYTLRSNCEQFAVEDLADQDWERVWLDQFKPQCFGDKLWIYPSGFRAPDDEPYVRLDPGLAFGTGDHPTTRLCLEWLASNVICEQRILDFGCGSGILSLAAHKLGARHVTATDNDPQAVRSCRLNALRNDIDNNFWVCPPDEVAGLYDIIVANILCQPLIELAPRLLDLLAPHGTLVLSGLLTHQMDMITQAYAPQVTFAPPSSDDDWILISGSKPATLTAN